MRMHRLIDRLEPKIIRSAVRNTALHPTSGKHRREPVAIVVPPVLDLDQPANLHHRRPPKLAANDDQRLLQQTAAGTFARSSVNKAAAIGPSA